MITIIDKLVELQTLLSTPGPRSAVAQTLEQSLRAQVPKPILDHFDRLLAQGKTGVAIVRHGVCGGCHLRICSGTAAGLARHDDLYICDNCGRYLYLAPESEAVETTEPAPPKPRRQPRKPTSQAMVSV
jgi:hypothetical protein